MVSFLVSVFFFVVSCCITGLAVATNVPKVNADNISAASNFFIVLIFKFNYNTVVHNCAKAPEENNSTRYQLFTINMFLIIVDLFHRMAIKAT